MAIVVLNEIPKGLAERFTADRVDGTFRIRFTIGAKHG